MATISEFTLEPEIAFNDEAFLKYIAAQSYRLFSSQKPHKILRRSIDSRSRNTKVNVSVEFFDKNESVPLLSYRLPEKINSDPKSVIIVGAGPAGLFAALKLLELGHKPIIFERGKDVRGRRRDIAAINKFHIINDDSNYCFGEGGAGTYSDGKLYTRSSKRGDINRILEILVAHGATQEILIDAHPHIGTNKLPPLIQKMRENIIELGGEIHIEERITDLIVEFGEIKGTVTSKGDRHKADGVILATGHSARDIYHLLHSKNILIEQKPFALGVRVEHQQSLIDKIQYKCEERGEWLPAASYSLVSQENVGTSVKGVFSFCMCPGGFIVPSATTAGEVVVNGMSPSRRDSKFSNSGIVVQVDENDTKAFHNYGPLAGLFFQEQIEKRACDEAGNSQKAPGQRLVDFVNNKVSSDLPESSYQPGMVSTNISQILPGYISETLKKGFQTFGKKMNGYLTNDAVILGVESRTSSPVRIPRDKESLEHVQIARLFPCGEGAGYAGGIVSAAMDGENCAAKWAEKYG